jgi:hypothetical protein
MCQTLNRKISPNFIDPCFFHRFSWLQPQNDKDSWYYGLPFSGVVKMPSNPNFYKTLDEGLFSAVKHLHRKGYPTTPSCTGHFYPEDMYRNIWDGIDSTCQKIRESGVCFLDPETGREYKCRDHNFQIPFTKKNFVHQAMQQGHKGVLGMFDPEEKIYTNLEHSMIPGTEIGRDGPLTLFLTHPQDEQELNSMWENFTDLILQI